MTSPESAPPINANLPADGQPLLESQSREVAEENHSIFRNLVTGISPLVRIIIHCLVNLTAILGTASLAQLGALGLFAPVWAAVFSKPLMLISVHLLANSLAVVLLVQAILVLQPTSGQKNKVKGTRVHAAFNALATIAFFVAAMAIVINKGDHLWEIKSTHAVLGLITYAALLIQVLIGVAQYFLPQIFGGTVNAKKLYKYHRWAGYALTTLLVIVVSFATQTDYNLSITGIKLWLTIAAGLLMLMGIIAGVRRDKLGI